MNPHPVAVDATYKKASTAFRNVLRWAREEKLTIRQLYQRFAGAWPAHAHRHAQIVDEMESWFLPRPTVLSNRRCSRRASTISSPW
jgi:alkanesulfonate monooxygenase